MIPWTPSGEAREPASCFWEITDACNLRCLHCEADAGRRLAGELSTDAALRVCEELGAAGCRCVNLTGGEPLLRQDWSVLARRLVELGVEVVLVTNGILVDDDVVSALVDIGFRGVAISVDGVASTHDLLRRYPSGSGSRSPHAAALAAFDRLAGRGPVLAAITAIHARNVNELSAVHEVLVARGVTHWQVQLAMPLGRFAEARDWMLPAAALKGLCATLAALAAASPIHIAVCDNIGYYEPGEPVMRSGKRRPRRVFAGCQAGLRVLALTSDGLVKGCPSHPRELAVGDLSKEPLGRIWEDEERFAYNTRFSETMLGGLCATCGYRWLCRGGCKSLAFATTGSLYRAGMCAAAARRTEHP